VKTAGTFEIESFDERKTMLMDHIATYQVKDIENS
jgi:hypothetical protein